MEPLEKNAEPSRAAIYAALHAAGIVTAEGGITGPLLDTPDAAVFALIERRELALALYVAADKRRRKTPIEKAACHHQYELAEAAVEELADVPAATAEGALAKAAIALPIIGAFHRLVVSALRDALGAPTAAARPEPATGRSTRRRSPRLAALAAAGILTPEGEVAGVAEADPDASLFRLLADMEGERDAGRPFDPSGPRPWAADRVARVKKYLELEKVVASTRATTAPGIMAKLQAALPTDEWEGGMRLARSAILDLLSVGLPAPA
jgi:hypothetical protein